MRSKYPNKLLLILSHYDRMQLELAIHKLHQETSVEELMLWGKVNGTLNFFKAFL